MRGIISANLNTGSRCYQAPVLFVFPLSREKCVAAVELGFQVRPLDELHLFASPGLRVVPFIWSRIMAPDNCPSIKTSLYRFSTFQVRNHLRKRGKKDSRNRYAVSRSADRWRVFRFVFKINIPTRSLVGTEKERLGGQMGQNSTAYAGGFSRRAGRKPIDAKTVFIFLKIC